MHTRLLLASALVFFSLSLPVVRAADNTETPLIVSGSQTWLDTGIDVAPGDSVLIAAEAKPGSCLLQSRWNSRHAGWRKSAVAVGEQGSTDCPIYRPRRCHLDRQERTVECRCPGAVISRNQSRLAFNLCLHRKGNGGAWAGRSYPISNRDAGQTLLRRSGVHEEPVRRKGIDRAR